MSNSSIIDSVGVVKDNHGLQSLTATNILCHYKFNLVLINFINKINSNVSKPKEQIIYE